MTLGSSLMNEVVLATAESSVETTEPRRVPLFEPGTGMRYLAIDPKPVEEVVLTPNEAVVELGSLRQGLFSQLAHVQRLEGAGYNRDFERTYIGRKVRALDMAIDLLVKP